MYKNCLFKIYGGTKDIESLPRYQKRITYTLKEIKEIIKAIGLIEEKMPENKMDKVLYIYDYIRKNIKYYPEEENDLLIRSLRVLITKHAVCSGYSLLFKELLDRQNIKCEYIKYYNHIWNHFCLNKKHYEVDLTWDACVYKRCPSSNLHFFANNKKMNKEHHGIKPCKNYLGNNLLKEYELFPIILKREDQSIFKLTLLPIGYNMKYYIYEDSNMIKLISSDDDFEIIYSRATDEVISSYVNCFFSEERIKKYNTYLGYGVVTKDCFYRRKNKYKETFIKDVKYEDGNIIINTIDKTYIIDNNYNMKEV